MSHAGDFELPVGLLGANFGYSLEDLDEEDSEDEDGIRTIWRNKETLFGDFTRVTTITESQSFLFKENRLTLQRYYRRSA